jgi:hypothetical protein
MHTVSDFSSGIGTGPRWRPPPIHCAGLHCSRLYLPNLKGGNMNITSTSAILACMLAAIAGGASAQSADKLQAPMSLATPGGPGKMIGTVTITESKNGLVFTPALTDLPA